MKFLLTEGNFAKAEQYKKMGFKCGLEIHQQLDTEKKLFCRCPVGYINNEPDARILRHMRPTLSELGEYDGTALMEFKTRKEVIYQLYRDRMCTYEMDDTPPFPINQEAVDIAIEIALLFNCSIVDEAHIVRKQYLDGSIPTGFQRTSVIGLDGWIPFKERKIRIRMVTLEEDACREVSDTGHTITFRTDRLSTPLVEIITDPDILSPLEVEEVNWLCAEVLRSSGKVRRGIGTARQDVNVSISGGTRVEIKGVSKIGYHAALTHNEAFRQKGLLEIKDILAKAGIKSREDFEFRRIELSSEDGWADIIPGFDKDEHTAKGLSVKGIKDAINHEVQPDTTLADEISSTIKVVACLDHLPNMIHSRAKNDNFIPESVWEKLFDNEKLDADSTLFIVWGNHRDVETALGEIEDRLFAATKGIPDETRQPMKNGLTKFERVLPGPDRMYPDTDSSPTKITAERLERIKKDLPPRPWEVRKFCEASNVPSGVTDRILRDGLGPQFDALCKKSIFSVRKTAIFIADRIPQLRREGFDLPRHNIAWVEGILTSFDKSKDYTLEQLTAVAREILSGSKNSVKDALAAFQSQVPKKEKITTEIDSVIKDTDGKIAGTDTNVRINYIIGRLKERFGVGLNGAEIRDLIKERLIQNT